MASLARLHLLAFTTDAVVGGVPRTTNPPPFSSVAPPADIAVAGVHPPQATVPN